MSFSCASKFPTELVTLISPNSIYTGNLPNPFVGLFFRFDSIINELIQINLNLSPNDGQPMNVIFELFSFDAGANTYTSLGAATSQLFINNFSFSVTPGSYYFCVKTTTGNIDISFSVAFTGFPFSVLGDPVAYHGHNIEPIDFAPQATDCDVPIVYAHIAGELPQGITFLAEGIFLGKPTELDCAPQAPETPSFSQFDILPTQRESTSREYTVTIRAALLDNPTIFTDRDFRLEVYNNWSLDRDHFVSLSASWETPIFVNVSEQPTKDFSLVVPELTIEEQMKSPCDTVVCSPKTEDVPLSDTIQSPCLPCPTLTEIEFIRTLVKGTVCDIECPEPPNVPTEEISEISVQLCPVKITEESDFIQEIPSTMCPQKPTVPIITTEPQYVDGVPVVCTDKLLEDMQNNSICVTRVVCDSVENVYPPVPAVEEIVLKSPCEIENDCE